MFAVVVTFTIEKEDKAAFLPLMKANAQTSMDAEPGCQRFDVWTDPARPDEVFLYEIYDDESAFDAHLKSNHFKEFDAKTKAMIQAKQIQTYREVQL